MKAKAMIPTNRRAMMTSAATVGLALGLLGLTRCSVTTADGVTTVTIDTAAIDTRGSAIIQALQAVLAAPTILALLGPNAVIATTAVGAAQDALQEIDALTHGTLSVSVDKTKVANLVSSIVTDAQTVLTLVQSQVSKLPGTLVTKVGDYIAAVLTLLPLLQVAANITGAPKLERPLMTEEQALQIATH